LRAIRLKSLTRTAKKTGYGHLFLREDKKSLKIPKRYSEAVIRRRTDNTMAK